MTNTAFPLEKILTISVRDWCEISGKELREYIAKGVHAIGDHYRLREAFQNAVPSDVEVVVEYRFGSQLASGTALIPRKQK